MWYLIELFYDRNAFVVLKPAPSCEAALFSADMLSRLLPGRFFSAHFSDVLDLKEGALDG